MVLINHDIKSGNYCIKNKHNINISSLINNLNKSLRKKIKVKYENKPIDSINLKNLKTLPKWQPNKNIEKKIINTFKYETT